MYVRNFFSTHITTIMELLVMELPALGLSV